MTNCEKARDMMSLYIDGELTDTERTAFEAHISACPDCAAMLDTMREVSELMREDVEPPKELLTGVMQGVKKINSDRAITKKRTRTVVLKWLSAAACVALVFFAVLSVPGWKGVSSDSAGIVESDLNATTATSNTATVQDTEEASLDSVPFMAEKASDDTENGLITDAAESEESDDDDIYVSGSVPSEAEDSSEESAENVTMSAQAPREGGFEGIDYEIAAKYRVVIYAPNVPEDIDAATIDLPDGRTGVEISYDDAMNAIDNGFWVSFDWFFPEDGAESDLALIVITE